MTGAPSVSEDPGATAAPTPYEAPLDLATTLSRPRQYVKAVLRLLVQRWDPFVRPTEDEKTGDLRFTKVPVEEANARLLQVVVRYLKLHGEFFLAPGPHYLDGRKKAIYRLHPRTAFPVLFPLGFRATERCYHMLAVNLYEHIMHGEYPQRKVHHISYMSPDAVYLWSAPHRMLKITTRAIEEVGVGTDGVLLQAEHIAPFPSLDELKPRIEALRPRLGDAVTKLIPGTPLSAVYTTRWSSESHLLPEQARQMVFTRFLFVPAASRYTLWPLVLITGPEDSGKSTLLEIAIAFFTGKHEEIVVDTLPSKIDSFYASVTNSSYLHYDNIDDPKHTVLTSEYNNLICQLATGAKLPIRVLHRDNEKRDYPVKVHASFTATTCPFERSAVMRRCLHFEVTNTGKEIDKMKILNAVLDNRADLLAEYLLRTQNMLRAHIANAEKEYELISGMAEYERFTLICADYEGALADMQAIWQAYASMYRETISNPNQLVYALRLWLGQDLARAGKQYPAETLYFAVQRLYQSLGQKFGYGTVGTFGRAIAKQLNSLSVIGIRKKRAKRGILYTFEPSAKELSICRSAYEDVRPGITTSSTPANPPMEFETEEPAQRGMAKWPVN